MNTIATIAGLAIATTTLTASADVLLEIDLSVVNQITITATAGLSSADASGPDTTGVLLQDFFNAPTTVFLNTSGIGDLVANGNSADGNPRLYNELGNTGLNFWAWTTDSSSDFVAGSVAFTGSATWDVLSHRYTEMLAGSTFGDIYAFADTDDDIATGAVVIGQYNVVPAPGAFALLGLTGLAATRRRRA